MRLEFGRESFLGLGGAVEMRGAAFRSNQINDLGGNVEEFEILEDSEVLSDLFYKLLNTCLVYMNLLIFKPLPVG